LNQGSADSWKEAIQACPASLPLRIWQVASTSPVPKASATPLSTASAGKSLQLLIRDGTGPPRRPATILAIARSGIFGKVSLQNPKKSR
jgi:hypothetical protein